MTAVSSAELPMPPPPERDQPISLGETAPTEPPPHTVTETQPAELPVTVTFRGESYTPDELRKVCPFLENLGETAFRAVVTHYAVSGGSETSHPPAPDKEQKPSQSLFTEPKKPVTPKPDPVETPPARTERPSVTPLDIPHEIHTRTEQAPEINRTERPRRPSKTKERPVKKPATVAKKVTEPKPTRRAAPGRKNGRNTHNVPKAPEAKKETDPARMPPAPATATPSRPTVETEAKDASTEPPAYEPVPIEETPPAAAQSPETAPPIIQDVTERADPLIAETEAVPSLPPSTEERFETPAVDDPLTFVIPETAAVSENQVEAMTPAFAPENVADDAEVFTFQIPEMPSEVTSVVVPEVSESTAVEHPSRSTEHPAAPDHPERIVKPAETLTTDTPDVTVAHVLEAAVTLIADQEPEKIEAIHEAVVGIGRLLEEIPAERNDDTSIAEKTQEQSERLEVLVKTLLETIGMDPDQREIERVTGFLLKHRPFLTELDPEETEELYDEGMHEKLRHFIGALKQLTRKLAAVRAALGRYALFTLLQRDVPIAN